MPGGCCAGGGNSSLPDEFDYLATESLRHQDDKSSGLLKVVVLGESGIGKTCLLKRLVDGCFMEHQATLGASFVQEQLELADGRSVTLQIWDTAGQERYRSLAPMYYRDADVALVMYSCVEPESLSAAMRWIEELQKHLDRLPVIVVCATKLDLTEGGVYRHVSSESALAELHERFPPPDKGAGVVVPDSIVETSAKTGKGMAEFTGSLKAAVVTHCARTR